MGCQSGECQMEAVLSDGVPEGGDPEGGFPGDAEVVEVCCANTGIAADTVRRSSERVNSRFFIGMDSCPVHTAIQKS